MAPNSLRLVYQPGPHTLVSVPGAAVLVELPPDDELVGQLFESLLAGIDVDQLLEILVRPGLFSVKRCIVGEWDESSTRVVARGSFRAASAAGSEVVGSPIFNDQTLPTLDVRLDAGVALDDAPWLPLISGVVQAAAVQTTSYPQAVQAAAEAAAAAAAEAAAAEAAAAQAAAEQADEVPDTADDDAEAGADSEDVETSGGSRFAPDDVEPGAEPGAESEVASEPAHAPESAPEPEQTSEPEPESAPEAEPVPETEPEPTPEPAPEAGPEPTGGPEADSEPGTEAEGAPQPEPFQPPDADQPAVDQPAAEEEEIPPPPPPPTAGLIESVPWAGPASVATPTPPEETLVPDSVNTQDRPGEAFNGELTLDRRQLTDPAPVSQVMVAAVFCPSGHLTPPYQPTCRVCGAPVVAQDPVEVPRPSLGVLLFANGDRVNLDRPVVMGRNPRIPLGYTGEQPNLLQLSDPDKDVSGQHLQVALDSWQVLAIDLGSTNGTQVVLPGEEPVQLRPNDPLMLRPGSWVILGGAIEFWYEVAG